MFIKRWVFPKKLKEKKSSVGVKWYSEMMSVQVGRPKALTVSWYEMGFSIIWLPHCGIWPYLDLEGCWGTVWDNWASLFHLSCYFLQFQVTDFKNRAPNLVADPVTSNHFFSLAAPGKIFVPQSGIEPPLSAEETTSLNHWNTKEVTQQLFFWLLSRQVLLASLFLF